MKYPAPRSQIEFDDKKHAGEYLFIPIDFGYEDGWNFTVRDIYRIGYLVTGDGQHDYKCAWTFLKREKDYSKPEYFDEEKGKFIFCKCEECTSGQARRKNLDRFPEVLLEH